MQVLRSRFYLVVVGLSFVIFAAQPARASQPESDRSAQTVPAIYVGNQQISTPAFVDGRQLFVPVRGVFEAIDAHVEFSPPQFVIVRKDGVVIAAFMLDRKHAIVGRQAVDLDAAPTRRDGRVYVPLRVVAQAAGATVSYTSRPPAVHIRRGGAPALDAATSDSTPELPSTARLRMGVAVFTGMCCLGCLVLTARRFAPTLFGPGPKHAAVSLPRWPKRAGRTPLGEPRPSPAVLPAEPEHAVFQAQREPDGSTPTAAPPDRVAVTSVETTGEARLHKEIVNETRTIEVPVRREVLVIEYTGEGGAVLIQGRELASGETVRIPLWEERVHVDVTKHRLLEEDIVVGKRRFPSCPAVPESAVPVDLGVAEGSPS